MARGGPGGRPSGEEVAFSENPIRFFALLSPAGPGSAWIVFLTVVPGQPGARLACYTRDGRLTGSGSYGAMGDAVLEAEQVLDVAPDDWQEVPASAGDAFEWAFPGRGRTPDR